MSVCVFQVANVIAVLPWYSPANQARALERNEAVEQYFRLCFNAAEILIFLFTIHEVHLSLRQLRRILRKRCCRKRTDPTDVNTVAQAVEKELKDSGRRPWLQGSASEINERLPFFCFENHRAQSAQNT